MVINRMSYYQTVSFGNEGVDPRLLGQVKNALRVIVEWKAPAVSLARKRATLRDSLRAFCLKLELFLQVEEEGGYLSEVDDTRPSWHRRICQLRDEHDDLHHRIDHLMPQVNDSMAWEGACFEEACVEICELLDHVEVYDRHEIALLQDTVLVEEGGEG